MCRGYFLSPVYMQKSIAGVNVRDAPLDLRVYTHIQTPNSEPRSVKRMVGRIMANVGRVFRDAFIN